MLINGNNLSKSIIEIVERENKLINAVEKINQRHETARNLKNAVELEAIINEGREIEFEFKKLVGEKVILMSLFVNQNRNFKSN